MIPEFQRPEDQLKKAAEDALQGSVGRFVKIRVRTMRLKELGAPEVILANEARMGDENLIRINYFSKILSVQPSEVMRNSIAQIMERIDGGSYYMGYLNNYGREDRVHLEQIQRDIEQGAINFRDITKEEEQTLQNALQERLLHEETEIPDYKNKFFFNGEWYDSGETVVVKKQGDEFLPPVLEVALLPGRKIDIKLSRWDKEVFPRSGEEEELFDVTYRQDNAVMYYDNDIPENKTKRTITCLAEDSTEIDIMKGSFYLLEYFVRRRAVDSTSQLTENERIRLMEILEFDAGLPQERLRTMSTLRLLSSLVKFVGDKNSGERTEFTDDELDISKLINSYDKDGKFPGTCKAVSTFMAGFCEALNIPARIVHGNVVFNDGSGGGHAWPEVYVPSINKWIPADPSLGTLTIYPDEEIIYYLDSEINPSDHAIKMSVSYRDQEGNKN